MANPGDIILNILLQGNQQALTGIKQLSSSLTSLGVVVTGITTAFLALSKNTSNIATDFDASMRNVNSILQITDESFKSLKESIVDISLLKDVKDTATGISKAMYDIASSGYSASEALEIAKIASKNASAGMTDTATATNGLIKIMSAYNTKTIPDAIKISNQMFKVVDAGNISFDNLSNNLSNVLAISGPLGIGFDTIGGAYIELSKIMEAPQLQTALSGLLRQLSNLTPESKKYAEQIGLDLSETALRSRELTDILNDLYKATGGSVQELSKIITDSEARNAALILTKNNAEGLAESIDKVRKASQGAGSVNKALSQQLQSFDSEVKQLTSSIQAFSISFGDLINNELRPFINIGKDIFLFFTNLSEPTKKAVIYIGAFGVAITSLGVALGGLVLFFNPLISAIISLSALLAGPMSTALLAIISNFLSLSYLIGTGGAVGLSITLLIAGFNKLYKVIDTVVQGVKWLKAEFDLKVANQQLEKQKNTAKDLVKEYQKLSKADKERLSPIELKKYSQAHANMITFVEGSLKEAYKRQAIMINEDSKLKQSAIEKERIAQKVKDFNESERIKNLNIQKIKESEDNEKRLKKEQELSERNVRIKEQQEQENKRKYEQGLSELERLREQYTDKTNNLTLDEYHYKEYLINKEYQDKERQLKELKKLGLTNNNDFLSIEKIKNLELDNLDNERYRKREKQSQEYYEFYTSEIEKEKKEIEAFNQDTMKIVDDMLKELRDKDREESNKKKQQKEKELKELKAHYNSQKEYADLIISEMSGIFREFLGINNNMISLLEEAGKSLIPVYDEVSNALISSFDPLTLSIKLAILQIKEMGNTFKGTFEQVKNYGVKNFNDSMIAMYRFIDSLNPNSALLRLFGVQTDVTKGLLSGEMSEAWDKANKQREAFAEEARKISEEQSKISKKSDEEESQSAKKSHEEQLKQEIEIEKLKASLHKDELVRIQAESKAEEKNIKLEEKNEIIKELKLQKLKQDTDDKITKHLIDNQKKLIDIEKEKFETRNKNVDDNIKRIQSEYKTEYDRVQEIKKALYGDKNDIGTKQNILSQFNKDLASVNVNLFNPIDLANLEFSTRKKNIEDEFLIGKITANQKYELEKKIELDKFVYFDNLSKQLIENTEEREQLYQEARQARENYFNTEIERKTLETEQRIREEKMKNLSNELNQEINNAKIIEGEYYTAISNINTANQGMINSLNSGLTSTISSFGIGMVNVINAIKSTFSTLPVIGSSASSNISNQIVKDNLIKSAKMSLPFGVGAYATGGIIDKPTLAMMGEKGTEAIFNTKQLNNLFKMLNGGNMSYAGNVNIYFMGNISANEKDLNYIVNAVSKGIAKAKNNTYY